MGYMDGLRNSQRKRDCWGDPRLYEQYSKECLGCPQQHSCRTEVDRSGRPTPIPVRRWDGGNSRRQESHQRDGVEVYRDGDLVGENESAFDRFFKDAAAGALRGCFYEMYEFWRRYRIP